MKRKFSLTKSLLNRSVEEECGHLSTTVINQMQVPVQCVYCQKLTTDTKQHMDAVHLKPICEYCALSTSASDDDQYSVLKNVSPTTPTSIPFSNSKTNALRKKIKTTESNIQYLDDQFKHVQTSLRRLSEECSSLNSTCQQQNLSMNKLQADQNMTERKLLDMQEKMKNSQYISYDGSLVWRIDHFAEKFEAARSEQQTSIYSAVFYTSPTGYKMRVRLDLYGDGYAKGTHTSIFLVLLKGDYDAILTWPFTYPVTFCLFDQTGQKHHIIESISFQRPCSKMNIASGILKFCPLAVIVQEDNCYVKDDTMFIKVMVDFFGIPRSVLPYTLAINPGLPTHEQEAQHRTKIEKHKQIRAKLQDELARNDEEVRKHSLLPTGLRVSLNNEQHPSSSATNLESIPCEDILND